MSNIASYLASLGKPTIIEEVSHDTILAALKVDLITAMQAHGIDYDVADLESDTAVIQAEASGWQEVRLRTRGNEIARDNYLYFSAGAGLDHKGAFYDCIRMDGETDERYMRRIILAIEARSTGGTEARYKLIAMSASLLVEDVVVYVVDPDPTVHVAVYSTAPTGVADAALLALVDAALQARDVRMINDTVVVRSAVTRVVNVAANIWLQPSADQAIVANLQTSIPTAWADTAGLGQDLPVEWLTAAGMAVGVYKFVVTSPVIPTIAEPYEAIRIGTVTLSYQGRAW